MDKKDNSLSLHLGGLAGVITNFNLKGYKMKLQDVKLQLDEIRSTDNHSKILKEFMHSLNLPFNYRLVDTILLMTPTKNNIKILDYVAKNHLVTL